MQWTTATETNNRGFYIQRKKANEQEWIDLDFIEGKGNSTEINFYSYKNILTESGVYFYRLKQTDFDGTYNYSEEIEIYFSVPLEYELFQNFPNPFNPVTTIKYDLPASLNPSKGGTLVNLVIYDILGRRVKVLVNEIQQAGRYEVLRNI
ncbi:MAG: hypothetical protein DYG97_14820 [Ignavibacteria bacterium CHB3]|nr:hypothetical protein [Ignavibacteria bacterium CHB3]